MKFQVYLAKQYISHLKSVSVDQEVKVFKFLYEAVKAKHLIDEANEMTKVCASSWLSQDC